MGLLLNLCYSRLRGHCRRKGRAGKSGQQMAPRAPEAQSAQADWRVLDLPKLVEESESAHYKGFLWNGQNSDSPSHVQVRISSVRSKGISILFAFRPKNCSEKAALPPICLQWSCWASGAVPLSGEGKGGEPRLVYPATFSSHWMVRGVHSVIPGHTLTSLLGRNLLEGMPQDCEGTQCKSHTRAHLRGRTGREREPFQHPAMSSKVKF